jgi:hypothetical protein
MVPSDSPTFEDAVPRQRPLISQAGSPRVDSSSATRGGDAVDGERRIYSGCGSAARRRGGTLPSRRPARRREGVMQRDRIDDGSKDIVRVLRWEVP